MLALPLALPCQVSRVSCRELPFFCTAKSTIVVVPPQAAARVPVSKSSAENVPPNGISRWVCTSMPPGMTYWPAASRVRSTWPARAPVWAGARSAATVSPSTPRMRVRTVPP